MASRTITGGFSNNMNASASAVGQKTGYTYRSTPTLADQLTLIGTDLSTIGDEEQYTALGNAAANSAMAYFEEKLNRLKDAWNTKTEITVGALMGQAAPYVMDLGGAVKALGSKVDDLAAYILGIDIGEGWDSAGGGWNTVGRIADDIGGDMLSYMAQDQTLQNTLSSLSVVRAFGDALSVYDTISTTITKVMQKVETIMPIVDITVDLILSFYTGGTSTASAAQKSAELAQQRIEKLTALAAMVLRKYVYNIKIKVPSLLVGAVNTLSVRDAVLGGNDTDDWLRLLFDDDFYRQTLYSANWDQSISTALKDMMNVKGSVDGLVNDWSGFNFTNLKGESVLRGDFMKSRFMSRLTSDFMARAVSTARKTAYIRSFTDTDWSRPSILTRTDGAFGSSDGSSEKTDLDSVLDDDDKEMSPITDLKAIRTVSSRLLAEM